MEKPLPNDEHRPATGPADFKACPHASSSQKGSRGDGGCAGSDIFCDEAWLRLQAALKISGRELQVVRLMFDDATEVSIGDDLGISPHTVHTYTERLYRKLKVRDRVQLVLRVTQEFLDLSLQANSGLPPICPLLSTQSCPFAK